MKEKKVTLKPGKDKPIRNRHHWIFSGAISSTPSFEDGDILPVYSHDQKLLGHAYFNSKTGLTGRMISYGDEDPYSYIQKSLAQAVDMRRQLFDGSQTNAYRLINGEGDALPGLIVDKYHDVLVIQVGTRGMDKLLPFIVENLAKLCQPKSIYEKSHGPSRRDEGMSDKSALLYGKELEEIEILENGLKFLVDVTEGQKTGFFLDHREMRQQIRTLSAGKRLLNCFAYTGGFSVYAAAGDASHVTSVDISADAIALAKRNMELNGFQEADFIAKDVFDFLREEQLDYDLVVLDPPAFAKRKKDIVQACRGYKDINRLALQKMPPGSILLTSSCSYHIDPELFQKVIFQAAIEANRQVKIIGRHRLAPDHPINIFHPEGDYLKSLLLYVN